MNYTTNIIGAALLCLLQLNIAWAQSSLKLQNPFYYYKGEQFNSVSAAQNCQGDLVITQDVLSGDTDIQSAGNSITASNVINNGGLADYSAGTKIHLLDGFHAKFGADFHAYLIGCNNSNKPLLRKTKEAITYDFIRNLPTGLETVAPSTLNLNAKPNPFNRQSYLEYQLVERTPVTLSISDMHGRKVRDLVNEVQDSGLYQISFFAQDLAAGIYLATLKAGAQSKTIKLVIVKP